jgi:hypothetical protein
MSNTDFQTSGLLKFPHRRLKRGGETLIRQNRTMRRARWAVLVGAVAWTTAREWAPSVTAHAESIAVPFTLIQSTTRDSIGELDRKITARRSDGTLFDSSLSSATH